MVSRGEEVVTVSKCSQSSVGWANKVTLSELVDCTTEGDMGTLLVDDWIALFKLVDCTTAGNRDTLLAIDSGDRITLFADDWIALVKLVDCTTTGDRDTLLVVDCIHVQ